MVHIECRHRRSWIWFERSFAQVYSGQEQYCGSSTEWIYCRQQKSSLVDWLGGSADWHNPCNKNYSWKARAEDRGIKSYTPTADEQPPSWSAGKNSLWPAIYRKYIQMPKTPTRSTVELESRITHTSRNTYTLLTHTFWLAKFTDPS